MSSQNQELTIGGVTIPSGSRRQEGLVEGLGSISG